MPDFHPAPADGARGSARGGPDAEPSTEAARDGSEPSSAHAEPLKGGQREGLKTGAAGLPGATQGRWPKPAGPDTQLRALPEQRRSWDVPPVSPGSAPGLPGASTPPNARGLSPAPAARAAQATPDGAAAPVPVPTWLALKTGAPVATQAGGEALRIPAPASPAKPKARHGWILALFLLLVVAPLGGAAWYLYTYAADQYASTLAFSVRKEEGPSASELLGGITGLAGGASSSDTDVLAEFIQSQELVSRIDDRLDLRNIYTKPESDPVFTLKADAAIEDLVAYWDRMITLFYDGAQGLIEVRVLAFEAQDAQDIAIAIYDESTEMINALTAIARDDATRFARDDLEVAIERLKAARTALTEFRSRTQIVDPTADIQGQMGLLNTLQAQLADSLIELDLLRETTRESDPRIRQTEQRIAVIEKRIDEERAKFGIGGGGSSDIAFADLMGQYESLIVDREFAEQAYLTALTNFDAAQAEAVRQSRYLAAHIQPTLAESAEYPRREMILLALAFFGIAIYGTLMLIYYSVKDRR